MDKSAYVLVLGGSVAVQEAASRQLENEFACTFWGDCLVKAPLLERADVVLLLDATETQADSLPHFYRSKSVLTTHDASLFLRSRGLGYLGANRNNQQLASLVRGALERIKKPSSRVLA